MLKRITPEPINRWFAERYGSRKGFVLTWWYRLLCSVGGYRRYHQVDWGSVRRLVFVCKGNVCRSAYAEVVARADGMAAVSCGIEAGTDVPAYDGAVMAAAVRGFDLGEHRTTPLRDLQVCSGDLLVAMEPWQVAYLQKLHDQTAGCTLLGLWGIRPSPHIHDPYGAVPEYFAKCFNELEDAVHEIDRKIAQASRR